MIFVLVGLEKNIKNVVENKKLLMTISYKEFTQVDIRVGKVLEVESFPDGNYSSHILKIDFGKEIGIKKSLARLAPVYSGPEIVEKLILAVTNFEPKQIGQHMSEVLILGLPDPDNNLSLVHPDREIPLGGKLH